MAAEEDDESRMELEQRLRAAVHYTVERVLEEEGEKAGLSFNRQVVAAIAETTFHQCSLFALDLEAFAKIALWLRGAPLSLMSASIVVPKPRVIPHGAGKLNRLGLVRPSRRVTAHSHINSTPHSCYQHTAPVGV
ncbi:centromere protein S isoform X2 [Lethenteron reissneri]|uniref:centromere protein S isoform X2 n=1 Tax=Lethenteron reissneri TaxID=7753 RepID=UPI002AB7C133|nr:centromere protein S isoform X2 [Lethenteron reissneri]